MVGRRIHRRMVPNRTDSMKGYVSFLRSHREEVEALCQNFLINVTNFFRDAEVFQNLKKKI